ncbi:hypothetical protein EPA93_38515 [Ktedonosporobacter rubrisoli]|uniref:Uncharacterized protein n=1 Tax=Ktedonosporobacter rubrisoli TaxID=2509675 RepID=A0A4P6K1K6_KTERU|nr:hypothetical protein [Ktedonosporobacter rubrisoli]QBD81550.1 hypothetical protein EPA93_38515 [Ktedonosporobacter rubrisoli]
MPTSNSAPKAEPRYRVKAGRKTIYKGNEQDAAVQAFLQAGKDYPFVRITYLAGGKLVAHIDVNAYVKQRVADLKQQVASERKAYEENIPAPSYQPAGRELDEHSGQC